MDTVQWILASCGALLLAGFLGLVTLTLVLAVTPRSRPIVLRPYVEPEKTTTTREKTFDLRAAVLDSDAILQATQEYDVLKFINVGKKRAELEHLLAHWYVVRPSRPLFPQAMLNISIATRHPVIRTSMHTYRPQTMSECLFPKGRLVVNESYLVG